MRGVSFGVRRLDIALAVTVSLPGRPVPFASLRLSACSSSPLGAWNGAVAEGLVLHKSVYSAGENVGALPGVISENMPPPAGQTEFYIPEQEAGVSGHQSGLTTFPTVKWKEP